MSDFWSLSLQLLRYRPRRTLKAMFWRLARKRVRAGHLLRRASEGTPLAYPHWLKAREKEGQAIARRLEQAGTFPSFTILIHGDSPGEARWRLSERSVAASEYPKQVVERLSTAELAAALQRVTTDYALLLRSGDRLAGCALARLAERIAEDSPALLFGDEDHPAAGGAATPWFKPDWNEELFLAVDYLSGAVALRRDLATQVASTDGAARLDALLLHATALAQSDIVHLSSVLVHRGTPFRPAPMRREDVQAHVGSRARCLAGPFGTVRVEWPLPDPRPLVSIIIPTRDRVELLRTCVESLTALTDYHPYEIVIVDNGSGEPATLAYLAELGDRADVRIVRSDAPFNFSALNNLGVLASRGDYLCLLNNDTEVIAGEWLAELMRYAARDEVGAVGAKLLYGDGTIQHAGVVVGMGEAAGHAHRLQRNDDPGYFAQAHAAQYMTAVTAACLVVARAKFEAVDGFDEAHFAVAYNDVDLCLRLQAAGWRNVYTPHAVLHHHESKSRGNDLSPTHRDRYMRELAVLQQRWGTKTYRDPLHSPHLDRYSETFTPVIELNHD